MKNKWMKGLSLLIIPVLAAGAIGVCTLAEGKEEKEVEIVFTHDLHSHLNAFNLEEDGKEQKVGGFSRMMTYLEDRRSENKNLLFLDGGDFSMGTLYQTVYESQASELRMLGYLGADATTLGNHEFDYRSQGLANMLTSALESQDRLPQMVVCNVDWEKTLSGENAKDGELLQNAFGEYGVKSYTMVEKGGVKIAVVGVFGKDALAGSPTCALSFQDPIEAVKETVKDIQKNEEADMIVCISHSGTWEDESKSEDEQLAKAVPELDLIISGHTHSMLSKPIVYGDTAIVSTGEYGARVGSLKLVQNEKGRWTPEDYELTLLDDSYGQNEEAQEKIDELGKTIDSEYLAQFGYTKDQVLTYNPWEFTKINGLGEVLQEETLGNLLADSYLYTVNNSDTGDKNQAVVAVVPSGCIRDTFHKDTEITVADAFQTLSLGIGADGVPGYPLVSIYLTGAELKTMAEVDASISPIMTTAQLYTSGMTYTLNPNRLILNKVTDVDLQDRSGKVEDLEEDRLYRVVADLYSGQMLGAVEDQSFGILSVTPKDVDGTIIAMEDLEDYIVQIKGQELKSWVCVADYLNSFEKTDGKSQIPEYYSATQQRKVVEDDDSMGAIIKNPNGIAVAMVSIAAGAVLLIIILITVLVRLVRRRRRRRNQRKES